MFEKKVKEGTRRLLVKECLKEKEEGKQKTKSGKEKEEYLKKEWNEHVGVRAGKNTRDRCQGNSRKIKKTRHRKTGTNTVQQKSRYNMVGLPEYLGKVRKGDSQKLMAQAGCGNMKNWNRYWEEEEKRKCDLCNEAPGTIEHLVRDYRETKGGVKKEDVVSGRRDKKDGWRW